MGWNSTGANLGCRPKRVVLGTIDVRRVEVHVFSVFLLFTFLAKAQQRKDLEGRVYSKDGDVAGIHVLNISSQKATITDANGFFSISAQLNDTLVFSAVQYKRKKVLVTHEILALKVVFVPLEDHLNRLDEVIVRPFNLSGDMAMDLEQLNIGPIITESTLNLPNAHVIPQTQSQRKLYTARTWDAHFYVIAAGTKLDPLINYFSGRTKILKQRIAREAKYDRIKKVRNFYTDSLYINGLNIPKDKIDDFVFFCETDSVFQKALDSHDRLRIWEFMKRKGSMYRKNNALD